MKSWMKHLIVAAGTLMMAFSAWAVDVNRATVQELQEVKGIGPVMAERIVKERSKGKFASWQDLQDRVSGVADGKSKQFSQSGLTVGTSTYKGIRATASSGKKSSGSSKASATKKTSDAGTSKGSTSSTASKKSSQSEAASADKKSGKSAGKKSSKSTKGKKSKKDKKEKKSNKSSDSTK